MKINFYKLISILSIIPFLLIISTQEILAQGENHCEKQPSQFTVIEKSAKVMIVSGGPFLPGGYWNINDGNDITACGGQLKNPFDTSGSHKLVYECIINFASPIPRIDKVEYLRHGRGSTGEEKLSLWYGGAWHLISDIPAYLGGTATQEITAGGPWHNVSKLRLYMRVEATNQWLKSTMYEIRAFTFPPAYVDIGLRVYKGGAIIAIAAEPGGTLTSPLRIAKDGNAYGIVLVDPADPNDSGIRIRTSSGIKALREYP